MKQRRQTSKNWVSSRFSNDNLILQGTSFVSRIQNAQKPPNPSSSQPEGRKNQRKLKKVRDQMAQLL
ncbi:hypothetical protein Ancab_000764 [Ancistrocladus abbreviatus]